MIDAEDLIITNKVISQELTFSRGKHIEDIYNYVAEFYVQPAFQSPRPKQNTKDHYQQRRKQF